MRGRPAEEPIPEDPQSPFQFSRMLFSQLGLTSWDKRGQVQIIEEMRQTSPGVEKSRQSSKIE